MGHVMSVNRLGAGSAIKKLFLHTMLYSGNREYISAILLSTYYQGNGMNNFYLALFRRDGDPQPPTIVNWPTFPIRWSPICSSKLYALF